MVLLRWGASCERTHSGSLIWHLVRPARAALSTGHNRAWHLLQHWITYRLRYAGADLFLGLIGMVPSEILASIADRLVREPVVKERGLCLDRAYAGAAPVRRSQQ
jgi:hypothetical protein